MIKLVLCGQPHKSWSLTGRSLTIGRDPSNDLVIDDGSVSDFHAEIINETGGIRVIDLVSANGTFVNNVRVRRRRVLKPWDMLRLGSIELEVNDPSTQRPGTWSLQARQEQSPAPSLTLHRLTVIGRDQDCDICIDDSMLSRRHAELTVIGDRVQLRDLDSANGTFVNNARVHERQLLPGDEIRVGSKSFLLVAPAEHAAAPAADADLTIVPRRSEQPEDATELLGARGDGAYLMEHSGLLDTSGKILLRDVTRIGRAGDNDIVIQDSSVSRLHAILRPDGSGWRIEDANSSNGIMLNGAKATAATLQDGDRIVLGRAEFSFNQV